jgi:hypothetical protein
MAKYFGQNSGEILKIVGNSGAKFVLPVTHYRKIHIKQSVRVTSFL